MTTKQTFEQRLMNLPDREFETRLRKFHDTAEQELRDLLACQRFQAQVHKNSIRSLRQRWRALKAKLSR